MVGLAAARVILISTILGQNGPMTFQSSVNGKKCISSLPVETLLDTPEWKDDDANPPVSARSAMNLAKIMRDGVITLPDDWEWHQGPLQLSERSPVRGKQRWMWAVNYNAARKKGNTPGSHRISIIVLMDGTVVKPTVEDLPEADKKPSD